MAMKSMAKSPSRSATPKPKTKAKTPMKASPAPKVVKKTPSKSSVKDDVEEVEVDASGLTKFVAKVKPFAFLFSAIFAVLLIVGLWFAVAYAHQHQYIDLDLSAYLEDGKKFAMEGLNSGLATINDLINGEPVPEPVKQTVQKAIKKDL